MSLLHCQNNLGYDVVDDMDISREKIDEVKK